MMQEVAVKTHLIITDVHEEYNVNWCGKFKDVDPLFMNDLPLFILISNEQRRELNTLDMKYIEKIGKEMTSPHGRKAVTTDKTRVFIKEADGKETLMCVITHDHVKKYAPMFDRVGYR